MFTSSTFNDFTPVEGGVEIKGEFYPFGKTLVLPLGEDEQVVLIPVLTQEGDTIVLDIGQLTPGRLWYILPTKGEKVHYSSNSKELEEGMKELRLLWEEKKAIRVYAVKHYLVSCV